MSTTQRLTLIGMYNYEPNIFDGLNLPAAYDKATFIESLLVEHGEKCVLYSDLPFMRYSIGVWSRKWFMELERIAEALKAEYNPLWNYDRYEEWNDAGGRRGSSETETGRTSNMKTEGAHVGQSETDESRKEESQTEGAHIGQSETNESRKEESQTEGAHIGQSETDESRKEESQTDGAHVGLSEREENKTGSGKTEGAHVGQSENTSSGHAETTADDSRVMKNNTDYQDKQTNNYSTTNETLVNATVEHQVAADNSSTYQPDSQDITNGGKNKTSNDGTITHDIKGAKDDLTERSRNEGTSSESANNTTNDTARDMTETDSSEKADGKTSESSRDTSENVVNGTGNTRKSDSARDTSENVVNGTGSTKNNDSARDTSENVINGSGNARTNDSTRDTTESGGEEKGTSISTNAEVNNSDHKGHLWGNIGVTTSSQMIIESVEMRMKYNL